MKLEPVWRFGSPGPVSPAVVNAFIELVSQIASQVDGRKSILELFKQRFAGAAGQSYYVSSDTGWAESDLHDYMRAASCNGPLFIDAFYETCETLRTRGEIEVPPVGVMNRILAEHGAGYQIEPPNLVAVGAQPAIASDEEITTSLDEEGQRLVLKSFAESERLLNEGSYRAAVQELLWLLETMATAFDGLPAGDGAIEGKYFNEIARSMRDLRRGSVLEQAIKWLMTLHGYLSSPQGGGVRHGRDLRSGIDLDRDEARLLTNLIRSYVMFLIAEHGRLTRAAVGSSD